MFFKKRIVKSDITENDASSDQTPWLLVGLGNPGPKYELTWHNAGFMCMDVLSAKHGIKISKIKFKGLYGLGTIGKQKVVLLKPSTFMNNSGESVAEAAAFYKVPHSKILIMYDDIDIQCGTLRIRANGSGGTHNGMRSVINHLGAMDFPRLRIGIGPLPDAREIVNYVLSEVPPQCRTNMFNSISNAADAVTAIVSEGVQSCMAKYNSIKPLPTDDMNGDS